MPCSSSSEGDAAAASWAVPRTLVTASRSSAAPVLRARIEERSILFIRQNLKRNCYRRITSISVVCHLPARWIAREGRSLFVPTECARPRAQQRSPAVGSWDFPPRRAGGSFLRPRTGALRGHRQAAAHRKAPAPQACIERVAPGLLRDCSSIALVLPPWVALGYPLGSPWVAMGHS